MTDTATGLTIDRIRQMDAIARSILDISVRLVALTMLIGGDQ